MHAAGDPPQTFRAVINRVGGGHVGQQRLRRADVARGLVAADVLLARAQRQAKRRPAARILRDAHQPAGHLTLEGVPRREKCRVRPAVAERHAESLGAPYRDIGAELTWRFQLREA